MLMHRISNVSVSLVPAAFFVSVATEYRKLRNPRGRDNARIYPTLKNYLLLKQRDSFRLNGRIF